MPEIKPPQVTFHHMKALQPVTAAGPFPMLERYLPAHAYGRFNKTAVSVLDRVDEYIKYLNRILTYLIKIIILEYPPSDPALIREVKDMPCPYFNIVTLKRSEGARIIYHAAYQSGERLYDERAHETHDYTDKKDVICTEILLPDNAPREYLDRGTLWNAVNAVESRKNAQLARQVVMALPKELSTEDNIRMVRQYCMEQFVARGMIADIAVHGPSNENQNMHAHVLLTKRAIDENGQWMLKRHREYEYDEAGNKIKDENGEWKVRIIRLDLDERDLYEKLRQAWEDIQNAYLEAAGRPERVSMKSYKEQGIDRIPQIHMSAAVVSMERKGIRTRIGDLNREIKKLNEQKEAEKRAAAGSGELHVSGETAETETAVQPAVPTFIDRLARRFGERQKETAGSIFALHRTGLSDSQRFEEITAYMKDNGICSLEDLDSRYARAYSERRSARERLTAVKSRAETVKRLLEEGKRKKRLDPVRDEYLSIHRKKRREKFADEHRHELDEWERADSFIRKELKSRPFDAKALQAELKSLKASFDELKKALDAANREYWIAGDIQYLVQVLDLKDEHDNGRYISGVKKQQWTLDDWIAKAVFEVADDGEIKRFKIPQRKETEMEL